MHVGSSATSTATAGIRAITWNANGLTAEGFEDFLDLAASTQKPWDAILVQEAPGVDEATVDVVQGGHMWCAAAKGDRPRSVAILLHRRLVESM